MLPLLSVPISSLSLRIHCTYASTPSDFTPMILNQLLLNIIAGSTKAEHSDAMSEGSQAVPPKKKTGRRVISKQPPLHHLPNLPPLPFNFPSFMPSLGNDTMVFIFNH